MSGGTDLIRFERLRQRTEEKYSDAHDARYVDGELAQAATAYIRAALEPGFWPVGSPPTSWPWDVEGWKPGTDPVQALVKAGALIAAELDRLLVARGGA